MDKLDVIRVTLQTGKVVLLREMQMKYEDLAMRAVGDRAGKNEMLMGKMMQDELMKILIVDVDGKKLTQQELEKLDSVFKYPEIISLRKVMSKLMGVEETNDPKFELVSGSGEQ